MRNLLRIFVLTKNEQRVVILILALLVTIATLKRWIEQQNSEPASPPGQDSNVVKPAVSPR